MVDSNFIDNYRGKRVFVTGHSGFKGSWLVNVLIKAGAIIKGYSLPPDTEPSLFKAIEKIISIESIFADINDAQRLETELLAFQPDFVFHLAAQPLVRKSYKEPLNTFSTNIIGTANLLNVINKLQNKCTVVLITTDKVYENKEWQYPYRETDRLGGYDPYSASKACAEIVINSYVQSFFNLTKYNQHNKAIVSVRAGNVIGGGDWSTDRLIPDIVTSIANNKKVMIRNPNAVRPWQHVLEPVFGYMQLAVLLSTQPLAFSGPWNFGPANADNLPVLEVAKKAIDVYGKGEIDLQADPNAQHEAGLLRLDISKAMNLMKWKPLMDTSMAVEKTVKWYKSFYENHEKPYDLMNADIDYYQTLLKK